jgi:hypothetical protein
LAKREIPQEIKIEILKKMAIPILTYCSETWPPTQKHKSRIKSTEMKFLRKIEGKTRQARIGNSTLEKTRK